MQATQPMQPAMNRQQAATRAQSALLSPPATNGYKRPEGMIGDWHQGTVNRLTVYDIDEMRRDAQIQFGLGILRSPIYDAKWLVHCQDARVANFVDATIKRFWTNDLDKALDMLEWGASGGEPIYRMPTSEVGIVEYDTLNDIHFMDMRPLQCNGRLCGLSLKNIPNKDRVRLETPGKWFWATLDAKHGQHYGRSRLGPAKDIWLEKRGKHGAVEIRRVWMFKNAFGGGLMRYPQGITQGETERGTDSNQEYARQITEQMMTGATMTIPSDKDEAGNYVWDYIPPAINGDVTQLLEYPKQLDTDILVALGIPPEVVQASEVGSGWSGRSVPFIVFLTGMNRVVNAVLRPLVDQIIRPLVMANFGPVPFDVEPVSLVPKEDPNAQQAADPNAPQPDPLDQMDAAAGQGKDAASMDQPPQVQMSVAGDPDAIEMAVVGQGRWITLGGHPEGDKKHVGGFHVFISDNGTILKGGHSGLHGKNVSQVKQHFDTLRQINRHKEEMEKTYGGMKNRVQPARTESKNVAPQPQIQLPQAPQQLQAGAPNAATNPASVASPTGGPVAPAATPAAQPAAQPAAGGGPGGGSVPQQPQAASSPVAPAAGGSGSASPDQGGATANQPDGAGVAQDVPATGGSPAATPAPTPAAKRVPARIEQVNRRLDRYQRYFQSKGHHEVAEWMGKLREHINAVGVEAALEAIGEDAGQGDGQETQYEGRAFDMSTFCEAYLSRFGISALPEVAETSDKGKRLVSSASPTFAKQVRPDPYLSGDFSPRDPTFKNKLDEAKHLPGLESSEDISVIMGQPVTHLTPDVAAKMDERYGPGQWIIKAYGDDAFAGHGIWFPQRVAQVRQNARDTIWQAGEQVGRYGFQLRRDTAGKVVGLQHQGGDQYDFGTDKYANTINGDVRMWADRAAAEADNEQGAALFDREGKVSGKDFMAQPAFKAVGISDDERARGVTGAEGGKGEGRVHIVTRNGKAEIVPHATWIKGEHLPVVFESEQTRAMAQAAVDAINALPESERQGQIYAPDVMPSATGFKVVEANPANETGSSGYLGDNPFIIDSYVSHLTGREPAHVQFIRKLLSQRNDEQAADMKGRVSDGKPKRGEVSNGTAGGSGGRPH